MEKMFFICRGKISWKFYFFILIFLCFLSFFYYRHEIHVRRDKNWLGKFLWGIFEKEKKFLFSNPTETKICTYFYYFSWVFCLFSVLFEFGSFFGTGMWEVGRGFAWIRGWEVGMDLLFWHVMRFRDVNAWHTYFKRLETSGKREWTWFLWYFARFQELNCLKMILQPNLSTLERFCPHLNQISTQKLKVRIESNHFSITTVI